MKIPRAQSSVKMRTRLFTFILAILLSMSALNFTVLLSWQTRYHRADRLSALKSEAEAAMLQIDSQLNAMNSISLSIGYSSVVKDRFGEILSIFDTSGSNYELNLSYRYLTDMLYAIIGPRLQVPQVYIYSLSTGYFGTGYDSGYMPGRGIRDFGWIDADNIGVRQYTAPHEDQRIYAAQHYEKGNLYVSLVRRFTNSLNIPQGYSEVVQRYNTIFASLSSLSGEGRTVFVFDGSGRKIYPAQSDVPLFDEAVALYQSGANIEAWHQLPGSRDFLSFTRSDQSDYILALAPTSGYLFSNFWPLIFGLVLILLAVVALMMLIGYLLARSFTLPIQRLHTALKHVDLDNLSGEFPEVATQIFELRELSRMIAEMTKKLNASMSKLLLTQRHELQARVLALQAQTNPHFIYNALFSIGAMASEGMNEEIERLCESLGSLMRYSSGTSEPVVPLGKELRYTKMYVSSMRIRFPDIRYHTDVDESLLDQAVPKLIVQLLVENAIKFCTTRRPPWNIRVLGELAEESMVLCIEDNGPGFDAETLTALRGQIGQIADSGLLPKLEINGMGILNFFLRIRLMYGEGATLELDNQEAGGAVTRVILPLRCWTPEDER
jgi:two-component system sensor histidine kinase YesM